MAVLQFWQLITNLLGNTYYIQPRRIGSETTPFTTTEALAPDGSNLTAVISTYYNNYRNTKFQEIENFMKKTFPEISSIETIMGAGSPPEATIHLGYGDRNGLRVPLSQCGTGIEQMLMIATVIFSATESQLLLIDEPHAFLHPAAEKHLLNLINEHTEHQYIVATHSAVFLNTIPLNQTRLISIGNDGTVVSNINEKAPILNELGITATDLWSSDSLLWIEGPSDKDILEAILHSSPDFQVSDINIIPMPDWIRSATATPSKANAVVKFCESVRSAVTPVKSKNIFLFDGDEKSTAEKEAIAKATNNSARFLGVREIENYLLVASIIHPVIHNICHNIEISSPTKDEVSKLLDDTIRETSNTKYYKIIPDGPDLGRIKGSAVLNTIWYRYVFIAYDKVLDGKALAHEAIRQKATIFEPLLALIRD